MHAARLIPPLLLVGAATASDGPSLDLALDSIEHPLFSAHGVRARLAKPGGGSAVVEMRELRIGDQRFRDVKLHCSNLRWSAAGVDCMQGRLASAGATPLRGSLHFSYKPTAFDLQFEPATGERWTLRSRGNTARRTVEAVLTKARVERLRPFVPVLAQFGVEAQVSGRATLSLSPRGTAMDATLDIAQGKFADSTGIHAGERLALQARLQVTESGPRWRWNAALEWRAGEVYWQPWYWGDRPLQAKAHGSIDAAQLHIAQAEIDAAGIGTVTATATLLRPELMLREASFETRPIDLERAAPVLIAPMLEQAGMPKLAASGTLSATGRIESGELRELDLRLGDVSLAEPGGRYGVRGVSGALPWRADAATTGNVRVAAANLGRLPLGSFTLQPELNGLTLNLPRVQIPVLDGALVLDDIEAAKTPQGWRGRMGGALHPVSMARLTETLALPRMSGVVSASIPRITHDRSTLKLDGALVIQLFDGFVSATNLRIVEPFGRVPRLQMDAEMRHIDLGQLTEAFSFGTITGFIDGDIKGLEMANWRPQRFDAAIASSPGRYSKRISQRAVQNITALGGAGAAAAIQRSVLRIFDEFGYDRLGLTCVLRDGVCSMGGVEETAQGYVIVKGGGVPAINVIGYNRRVDWEELLSRLQRVTASQARPIIR